MMWDGAGGAFMVVWTVFGFLLTALLVAAVVWLVVRAAAGSDRQPPPSPPNRSAGTPREELDRRYARGEIGRDEYLAIRDDLER